MSTILIKKLTLKDANDFSIYSFLQEIESCENHFTNPIYGKKFNEYQEWVITQVEISDGKNLPEGYVPQTIYIMYNNNIPVGIGKIRHSSSNKLLQSGGNIGYAISNKYRGNGLGYELMRLLIIKAFSLGVNPLIFSVDINNIISEKIVKKCGAELYSENDRFKIYILRR